jgi:hypothetical protein
MNCEDGCVEVELLLQQLEDRGNVSHGDKEDYDEEDWDYMEKDRKIVEKIPDCKCSEEIMTDDCGDINYAVASYTVSHGHLDCLKTLHKDGGLMWHADLAVCAAEAGQLECLKYVLEKMGDVAILEKDFTHVTSNKCIEYLNRNKNWRLTTGSP